MMRTMMPTGTIVMIIGIMPRIAPHMTVIMPTVIVVVMCPMMTPPKRIAGHVVPIIPVAPCRNHIGIHAIVVDIPFPTGPQSTAIHHIPIERTAHRNGIARIAETDNAHGILIV